MLPLPQWERDEVRVLPLPFIPSHQGRGNVPFYEDNKIEIQNSKTNY
jgi:hypothetical protein